MAYVLLKFHEFFGMRFWKLFLEMCKANLIKKYNLWIDKRVKDKIRIQTIFKFILVFNFFGNLFL